MASVKTAKKTVVRSMDEVIMGIAKRRLRFQTLETRDNDALNFRDVCVWDLKQALEEAYKAGMESAKNKE